ncbi:antirestriction protein ArdA [Amycolatopsis lurida]|uniref:antirestriction protein ArdA n=1 Tax=Amycolatopsis lurida TaxID=31959 RepID=UPI003651B366
MEQVPRTPQNGGERPTANSYGTDDPAEQARIERARTAASTERRRDRAELERLVELGLSPDAAETVIEYEHAHPAQHAPTRAPNPAAEQELLPYQAPRIYVSDLAAAEAGRLHGRWIDAAAPLPEIQEQIVALLAASPVPDADRFAVDDHRGFLGYQPNEHTPIAVIAKIANHIEQFGAAYAAFLSVIDATDLDLLDRFSDLYIGSFATREAWARSVGEELGWQEQLDRFADPLLRRYLMIDYRAFGENHHDGWDVVEGSDGKIHVFMR